MLAFHFLYGGLIGVSFHEFFFNFGDGHELRLLRSKIARGFRRVHLLAAVDHIGLLPCYSGISRHGDCCYAEALLQGAQMRTLVVEHIGATSARVRTIRLWVAPLISISSTARNSCNETEDTERT